MIQEFNENLALRVGLEEAIMYEVLKDIINSEKEFDVKGHNGVKWVRCSVRELSTKCAYFTVKQLERILNNMENGGLISSKNLNTNKHDRTKWYCVLEVIQKVTL